MRFLPAIFCGWFVALALALNCAQAPAQTAETFISQGRAQLAARNLTNANNSFLAAVSAAPNHQTGNVFYAATRLLALANQSPAQTLLNRLGDTGSRGDVYRWKSSFPKDANGNLIAPAGVNLNESSALLRTNGLPEIIAAGGNFSKVVDANFLLNLTSNETALADVTVDYGDVLMFRALLHTLEYFSYTEYSWNLDMPLTALRTLATNRNSTVEDFVRGFPQLFTFATTNDLNAAKTAFTNAVARYLEASDFIHARPTNVTGRLFNFDSTSAYEEDRFRLRLVDLRTSLDGVLSLVTDPILSVNLARHFDGSNPPRAFLPQVRNNSLVFGTLPDVTFGGLIFGLKTNEIERTLAHVLKGGVTHLASPKRRADGMFEFQFRGLDSDEYLVQFSTNLTNWASLGYLAPVNGVISLLDSGTTNQPRRFYRVVDFSAFMSLAGEVRDNLTSAQIPGAIISSSLDSTTAVTDSSGHFHLVTATPVTSLGRAYSIMVTASNYLPLAQFDFWPNHLNNFQARLSAPPPNDLFANRITITGTVATVTGYNTGATAELGEPSHATNQPANKSVWWTWTAPRDGMVTVDTRGSSFDTLLAVYTGDVVGELTPVASNDDEPGRNTSLVTFEVTATWTYQIAVDGYAGNGDEGSVQVNVVFYEPPANDNFANRTPLTGAFVNTVGNNILATKEPGETNHCPAPQGPGGKSVWWSWTAPKTGPVTISTVGSINSDTGDPLDTVIAAYFGTAVNNLTLVANDDSSGDSGAGEITFNAGAGLTYQIAVDGFGLADYGTIILTISQP